jgi:6-phosphofructokinase 1
MCGFTNFAIGHLKNRVAMVPIEQMICADKYCLRPEEENWQRLLATTGQPSFLNHEHEAAL